MTTALAAAALLLLLVSAAPAPAVGQGRTLLAKKVPVDVAGWGSPSAVAKELAKKLVDPAKFTTVKASFDGSVSGAGFVRFGDYGRWSKLEGGGGKPPGSFIAPWLPNGAVMLSTAKIVGTSWPAEKLELTPTRSSKLIPGSKRFTKLSLTLKSKVNGYLRMPWYWTDSGFSVFNMDESHPVHTDSTFRIIINGVDRALTADNRLVRLPTLYTPDPNDPDYYASYTGGDVKRLYHRIDLIGEYDPLEPIEFGGLAYTYTTKRVMVKAGATVTIDIVIGDLPSEWDRPSVLYLPPKSITTTPVDKCSKSSDCGSGKTCCGGICCSKEVQCCGGKECCASPNAQCISASPLAAATCCAGAATCEVDGTPTCCAPGKRCVDGNRCEA